MMANTHANHIKLTKTLILLGESETGKSKIIQRYIKKKYDDSYIQTYGVNFLSRDVKLFKENNEDDELNLTLCIWDCGGDESESKYLPQNIYKNANGFVIVCSYDCLSSLKNIYTYLIHIKQNSSLKNSVHNLPPSSNNTKKFDIPIFIIFNKSDIPDKDKAFSRKEIENLVKDLKLTEGGLNIKVYDKISAKNDVNVEYIFDRMIHIITGFYTQSYKNLYDCTNKSTYNKWIDASSEFEEDEQRTFVLKLESKMGIPFGIGKDHHDHFQDGKSCCN